MLYRQTHQLLEELAEATIEGTRKELMELFTSVPLLIIDDPGMRKLPATPAEDLLELIMRRYERASTLLTSNRPVEDWGKLLGGSAAVTASSIDCSITVMCSNAVRAAGAQKQTCLLGVQGKTNLSRAISVGRF